MLADTRLGVQLQTIAVDFQSVSKTHGKLYMPSLALPPMPIRWHQYHPQRVHKMVYSTKDERRHDSYLSAGAHQPWPRHRDRSVEFTAAALPSQLGAPR